MKVSLSLPDEDVQFLDEYAKSHDIASRSAVVHTAVRMLSTSKLGNAYEEAWQEWESSGEAVTRDDAAGEGVN